MEGFKGKKIPPIRVNSHWEEIIPTTKKDVLQEIWMTFYESIVNQGTQTSAVQMLIETSGECAMYFDLEARCVTDTSLRASYFTYLEKKGHKCLKCLQSSSCILHPANLRSGSIVSL